MSVKAGQAQKLLQAHYAEAVPLDLLKREQDRLTREIADAEETLNVSVLSLDKTEAAVSMAVDLAANCHRLYLDAPDSIRQLLNQAFFTHIYVDPDGTVRRSERTKPLGYFLKRDTPSVSADEAGAEQGEPAALEAGEEAWNPLTWTPTRRTPSRSFGPGVLVRQFWWGGQGSNLRPRDYESPALTS